MTKYAYMPNLPPVRSSLYDAALANLIKQYPHKVFIEEITGYDGMPDENVIELANEWLDKMKIESVWTFSRHFMRFTHKEDAVLFKMGLWFHVES